jgi:predicted nucleic acid-binding Zn ribbon protein
MAGIDDHGGEGVQVSGSRERERGEEEDEEWAKTIHNRAAKLRKSGAEGERNSRRRALLVIFLPTTRSGSILQVMATYVYETIPQKKGEKPRQFEVQQKMTEPALTHDPETGVPVKRIITGGSGWISHGASILSMGKRKRS